MTRPAHRLRTLFLQVAKLSIVVSILWYLVQTKKLDFLALRIYLEDPTLLLGNITLWLVGSVFITTIRWNMLLKGMGLHYPFGKILKLNLTGFFFNTVAPGAVGGDLVKAFYLFRAQNGSARTPAMLSILLDRIIGLYAVFTVATFAVLPSFSRFLHDPMLSSIALVGVAGFCGMSLVFLTLFFTKGPLEQKVLFQFLQKPYPGFALLQKITLSFFLLKDRPAYFVRSFALGVLYQVCYLGFFAFIAIRLGHSFSIADFAAIFPLGFIAAALPISPGGLGVGHLAFHQLFGLIGIANGATLFNFVFIGQNALNLLGVIPYMLLKKEREKSKHEDGAFVVTASQVESSGA